MMKIDVERTVTGIFFKVRTRAMPAFEGAAVDVQVSTLTSSGEPISPNADWLGRRRPYKLRHE